MRVQMLLVTTYAWLVAVPAAAQEPGSRQSRDFVQAAAQSDTFEILEAQTVLAQSTDPQVRAFAQAMIAAHTATSEALKAAAARAGLDMPAKAMSSDQAAMLNALQSQRGPEFDTMYARQQALAHRSALTTEQQYAASGDQPNLRAAAASGVPIISAHLQMAEQIQAKGGG
jgi:putative membrane protein